jgi:cytochrome c peroxidase
MRTLRVRLNAAALLLSSIAILGAGEAVAQVPPLSSVPVPGPSAEDLDKFIRNLPASQKAILVLGKALFWDMQVGSDGVQACGTCHFRAGADPRSKNQVSPGVLRVIFGMDGSVTAAPDLSFDGQGPNAPLQEGDFPFRKLKISTDRESEILSNPNNVVSSQGVHYALFGQSGDPGPDPDGFYVGLGRRRGNVRRVEPRNTPTMINAVFNHRNFWDMRAQNEFNGVNPFGGRDPNAVLYSAATRLSTPTAERVRLVNSSLASQAVGPPTNRFEMSADGRTFPEVGDRLMREVGRRHRFTGRRLLFGRPLALQLVARDDSVLGPYSRAPLRGLNLTYEALIRLAFERNWWDSTKLIRVDKNGVTTVADAADADPTTDEFTLMEYNFSLFFGLAVQAYEATLVSDQTPFDKFLAGQEPLSPAAERGRKIFFNENPDIPAPDQPIPNPPPGPRGGCSFCHSGALLSEASVQSIAGNVSPTNPTGMVRTSGVQRSDRGTRNIGVRETTEDLGLGSSDPFGHPLSVGAQNVPAGQVVAADGTFKIPGLRNVELTAPYFHTGGEATLMDVVNFYARGGNQGGASNPIKTRSGVVIGGLGILNFNTPNQFFDTEAARADLVEFLKSLTDDRVRDAAAPFDHPQIFVPNGHPGGPSSVTQLNGRAVDSFLEIPATGKNGGPALPGFLD